MTAYETNGVSPIFDAHIVADDAQVVAHDFNSALANGVQFAIEGKTQLDLLVRGEEVAKTGLLASMIAGKEAVHFAIPGTAKTLMADNSFKLAGIDEANVSRIPVKPNLTTDEIVGDTAKYAETTTTADGQETVRELSFDNEPILKPTTEFVLWDEGNRGSPDTAKAMLSVMQGRYADTRNGRIRFDNLLQVQTTQNPGERKQGLIAMPDALASRHLFGLPYQMDEDAAMDIHDELVFGKFSARPEAIQAVTSLDSLAAMRHFAQQIGIQDTTDMHTQVRHLATVSQNRLKANGINDGLGRAGTQIRQVAQALAMLKGEAVIGSNSDTLKQAYFYLTSARLGLLAVDGVEQANELYNELMAA